MSMPVISALDFTGESMVDETISKDSPMKTFYRNKTVFITGGTGFLGQLFVEKLLRCKVKEIYLLARPKKDKSSAERIQETFVGVVFSKLRMIDENYMTRIKLIEGDTQKIDLGISAADRKNLIENVEIVIHSAADVRFDKPLQELCLTNVRGTKDLIVLVGEMKKFIVFGYISTAYCQYHRERIEEKFYPPACDPEEMIRISEHFDKHQTEELNILTDKILQPWANTYVFTKSLSEELVRRVLPKFPCVIIRPSSIISTNEDPIPAWSNNIYGVNGVLFGSALGFIRITPCKADTRAEMICADFVTNGTLAAIWDKANERVSTDSNCCFDESKSIVHITAQDPRKCVDIYKKIRQDFFNYPSTLGIAVPATTFTDSPMMISVLTLLYHVMPAMAYDTFFKLTNSKYRLLPLYRKYQDFMNRVQYFGKRWNFDHNNLKRIIESMSEEDKKFFPCNPFNFDMIDYSYTYTLGMRTYVAKEPLDNHEAAKRKLLMLRFIYYPVLVFYYSCIGGMIYMFLHLTGITPYLKLMYDMMARFCGH